MFEPGSRRSGMSSRPQRDPQPLEPLTSSRTPRSNRGLRWLLIVAMGTPRVRPPLPDRRRQCRKDMPMTLTSHLGYGKFQLADFQPGECFARFDGTLAKVVDPQPPGRPDHI